MIRKWANLSSIFFFCALLVGMNFLMSVSIAETKQGIDALQAQWAIITYQEKDQERQAADISLLADEAAQYSHNHSDSPEALIWEAIITSTKAQIEGGYDGLHDAECARDLLLQAMRMNARVLHGVVYVSLGVLYYKVPGWPVGFGDNDIAKKYLQKGLALNPDGLDANFFYGEFLYETGEYAMAKIALDHGLQAAPLADPVADEGRRSEIRALLEKLRDKGY